MFLVAVLGGFWHAMALNPSTSTSKQVGNWTVGAAPLWRHSAANRSQHAMRHGPLPNKLLSSELEPVARNDDTTRRYRPVYHLQL